MKFLLIFCLVFIFGCSVSKPSTDVYLIHGLGYNGIIPSPTSKIKEDLESEGLKVTTMHWFQHIAEIDKPIILIGKSLGAHTALNICYELLNKNIKVKLLIIIDPFSCLDVPSNVERSVNIKSWSLGEIKCNRMEKVDAHHFFIGGVHQVREIILEEVRNAYFSG